MKYINLLLFLFFFSEVNSQSFERTYQTAPMNYREYASAGIAIGEKTIVSIEEDSTSKHNSKLIKLNKNGDIIKTQFLPNNYKYNVVNLTNINDTCIFVFLIEQSSSILFICKIDTDLNIQWFKYAGYFSCTVSNVKKINRNKFAIVGKFYQNGANPSSYLFIDSAGKILNYNSTFNFNDPGIYGIDAIETNDTVYTLHQTIAYLNTNGNIITSKRKNESTLLNINDIHFNTITYGDYIEFEGENIVVYGQNSFLNINNLRFKCTFDKNLNIIKIDSLKLSDGINEYMEFFAKDGEFCYYVDRDSKRITTVDKNFKIKTIQYIPTISVELTKFSVENGNVIITGRSFKSPPGSYVHRFNPTIPLGVDNINAEKFNIYPNPFINQFYISFDKEQSVVNLCIYNTLGQKVYTNTYEKTSNILVEDIDLEKGVYVVETITEDGRLTKKLIKD